MPGFIARLSKGATFSRRLVAIVAVAGALPVAAQGSVVATFDWVSGTNTAENPITAQTTAPSGTLALLLSSFALTPYTGTNPNLGPSYYTSGSATPATIAGFSYTAGNGLTANQSNLATTTLAATIWATSATDTPFGASSAGDYLVSAFSISGTTPQGSPFKIANAAGTADANYQNGVGNGDNSFNAAGSIPAITDGGYWKLASVTPVPLPAALPLLVCGFGGLGVFSRRRKVRN